MKNKIFVFAICLAFVCGILLNADSTKASTTGEDTRIPYIKATLLNQDPDPAEPGKYVELRWKVQKYRNQEIKNISFFLDVDYPFYFDESDNPEKNLGDWAGYSKDYEYFTLHYKLRVDKEAIEDVYKVKLIYKQEGNTKITKEYDVRVGDKKRPELVLGTIESSPSKLVADTKEAKLSIQIQNIGDKNAKNVKAKLDLPEKITPSYSYSDEYKIGTIEADSYATATFYVDIDEKAESKEYPAKIILNYKEENDKDNEYKTLELPIKIPIKNKPIYEIVSVETIPKEISASDKVELRLKIKNVGTKDANSVSIKGFKESSQPFEFDEKSDYIGKLRAGETADAVLKFTVDKEAIAKKYILDLEIRSIDENQVLSVDKSVEIEVKNSSNKNNKFIFYGIAAAVILIAISFVYQIIKNRKSKSN